MEEIQSQYSNGFETHQPIISGAKALEEKKKEAEKVEQ